MDLLKHFGKIQISIFSKIPHSYSAFCIRSTIHIVYICFELYVFCIKQWEISKIQKFQKLIFYFELCIRSIIHIFHMFIILFCLFLYMYIFIYLYIYIIIYLIIYVFISLIIYLFIVILLYCYIVLL